MKPGAHLSANMGTNDRSMAKDVRTPVFSLILKPGSLTNIRIHDVKVLRLGKNDGLWEFYVFRDVDAPSVLTAPNFAPKSDHVECDFDATGIDVSGGTLLSSGYYSGANDNSVTIEGDDINTVFANNIVGVSDLFVMAYTAIGGADNILISSSWREYF